MLKRSFSISILSSLGLFACGPGADAVSSTNTTAAAGAALTGSQDDGDAAAYAGVSQALAGLAAAWQAGDANGVAAATTDDVHRIGVYGEETQNKADLATLYTQAFQGMLKGSTLQVHLDTLRKIDDTTYLLDQTDQITFLGSDGSPLPPQSFHGTEVWVNVNGQWLARDVRCFQFQPMPAQAQQ